MLQNWFKAVLAFFLLVSVAHAQFNFFEHMFGGNQQQAQQQQGAQNVPSDSGRYQKMWQQCKTSISRLIGILHFMKPTTTHKSCTQLNAATTFARIL